MQLDAPARLREKGIAPDLFRTGRDSRTVRFWRVIESVPCDSNAEKAGRPFWPTNDVVQSISSISGEMRRIDRRPIELPPDEMNRLGSVRLAPVDANATTVRRHGRSLAGLPSHPTSVLSVCSSLQRKQ